MAARLLLAPCASAVCCFALGASAETAVEPVRIEFSADAGCPSERDVQREILSRTRRARMAEPGEAARLFRLSARSRPGKVVGRLEIVGLDGASTVREVTGNACGEVLEALTLVARIAIDPSQPLENESPALPVDTPRERKEPQPPQERKIVQRAAPRNAPLHARATQRPVRLRVGIGAQALATTLIAPDFAPGAGVFVDLVGTPPSWLGAQAGLRVLTSGAEETAAGTARFTLLAAHAVACLPRVELSQSWTLCPIASVEAGTLNARGSETSSGRSATRPWVAVGAGLRLEWKLSSSWFAQLDGEGSAPLVRDRFVFDEPPTTVHEPPRVGLSAGIGLGYRLP